MPTLLFYLILVAYRYIAFVTSDLQSYHFSKCYLIKPLLKFYDNEYEKDYIVRCYNTLMLNVTFKCYVTFAYKL